jgi:transcriptional regulator with GAF, ATPase, and Fis domain
MQTACQHQDHCKQWLAKICVNMTCSIDVFLTPSAVVMTTSHILNAVSPLIADLAQDLSERERLRRLLAALRNLLPADAVALLKLEGEWLRPMAIDGLMPDTLGRRFRLGEHPRFAQLLAAGQAMRFEPDSPLPDPMTGWWRTKARPSASCMCMTAWAACCSWAACPGVC